MKKKALVGAIGVGVLLVAIFGIYSVRSPDDKANSQEAEISPSRLIDVDRVVKHPEYFKGSIGVIGKVVKTNESKSLFVLGCEDACVMMPVRYTGQMPALGGEIIVYGQIKEVGGRYIFEGQEVRTR